MHNLIEAPRNGFSLQFIDAAARQIDWGNYSEGEDYTLILPAPTRGDVAEHAGDLARELWPDGESSDVHAPLDDEERQEFEQSDGGDEWRAGFAPMMNFGWPVALAYEGPDAETAAALIEANAGACVLIEPGEDMAEALFGWGSDAPEYLIALTGGGMDLSDHIAAAYLACGCAPPFRLLSGLSNALGARPGKADVLPLREAYARAADAFQHRAERLQAECRRVHGEPEPRRMVAADIGAALHGGGN